MFTRVNRPHSPPSSAVPAGGNSNSPRRRPLNISPHLLVQREGSSDNTTLPPIPRHQPAQPAKDEFDLDASLMALSTSSPKHHTAAVSLLFNLNKSFLVGLSEMLETARAGMLALTGAQYCTIFHIDTASGQLHWRDSKGADRTHPLAITLVGYCATSGEHISIKDFSSDRRFNQKVDVDSTISSKAQSVLMMPLRSSSGSVAVFSLVNKLGVDFFTDDDVTAVKLVCRALSPLVERELRNIKDLTEVKTTYTSRANELLDFAMEVSADLDLTKVQERILNDAKVLLQAERCSLFMVDQEAGVLTSVFATGARELQIKLGQGIAGAVASSGNAIVCNNPYEDPRFDTNMDSVTGFMTRSILCTPIKWKGEVIGVTQLINKNDGPFSDQDAETFKLFSSICSIALHNSQLFTESQKSKEKADSMLNFLRSQVESQMYGEALSSVMFTAKTIIGADRCSLFILDKNTNELRTRHADGLKEIRFPAKVGVAGRCLQARQGVICNDAYSDSTFYYAVDEQSEYKTQSLLAVPIMDSSNQVVAVGEMINKLEGGFTDQDMNLMTDFCAMAGKYLAWEQIGPLLLQQPNSDFLDRYTPKSGQKDALLSWGFNLWDKTMEDLVCLIVVMFDTLELNERFSIPRESLVRFVWSVARSYKKEVPYHNFYHAFDVTHAMFLYIYHAKLRETLLTDLDVLTLMVAATCHDLNHQGYTNSFMEKAETPFGMLYKNGAIMEHHHISILLQILSDSQNNIFGGCTSAQYREVWQDLITVILATDASHHMKQMTKFRSEFSDNRHTYDPNSKTHRRLLMAMLISWADTSNIVRPFPLAKKWAVQLSMEFFQEGDVEKGLGITPPPIFDREKMALTDMQVGFIQNVGIPSYTLLKNFLPQLSDCLERLQQNLQQWKREKASPTDANDNVVKCESVDEY